MTEEKKPLATVTALPPPKRWRPEAAIRLALANADRYAWIWCVAEDKEGRLAFIRSEMPSGAMSRVLQLAVQEAAKTGSQQT